MNNTLYLNKSNKKTLIADKKISIAVLSSFVVLMVQYFILYIFGFNETSIGSSIQTISKVIVGITFIYAFPATFKRSGIIFILAYSAAIAIFAFSYMFFEVNRPYLLEIAFKLFFISLPCFIYSYSLYDIDVFVKISRKAVAIIYVLGIVIGALGLTKRISIGTYSMTMSYYMLFPTIIFLKEFFERYSIKYLLLSAISALIMLAIGSRGAILCLGVYTLVYLLINIKKTSLQGIIVYTLVVFLVIGSIAFFKEILIVMNNILNQFGIYSRSITLFLKDSIHLSGRDIIYNKIINQILLHPLVGLGIAGDRVFLSGSYSHNIFLEIVSGFGVSAGSIIIVLLSITIFLSLLNKDKYKSNLLLVWMCIGFVPLIVSGSYLTYFQFWIFMGLALNILSNKSNNNPMSLL